MNARVKTSLMVVLALCVLVGCGADPTVPAGANVRTTASAEPLVGFPSAIGGLGPQGVAYSYEATDSGDFLDVKFEGRGSLRMKLIENSRPALTDLDRSKLEQIPESVRPLFDRYVLLTRSQIGQLVENRDVKIVLIEDRVAGLGDVHVSVHRTVSGAISLDLGTGKVDAPDLLRSATPCVGCETNLSTMQIRYTHGGHEFAVGVADPKTGNLCDGEETKSVTSLDLPAIGGIYVVVDLGAASQKVSPAVQVDTDFGTVCLGGMPSDDVLNLD